MNHQWLSVVLGVFLISGCFGGSEPVKIAPRLKVSAVDLGHGKSVYANVFDQRNVSLGKTGEVAWLFQQQMEEALLRKGFKPTSVEKNNAKLLLTIEDFQYETTKGFFKGTNRVQSRIKVSVVNKGHSYERIFQDGENIQRMFVSDNKALSDIFDYVVYEVLNQVFADEEMMKILAE